MHKRGAKSRARPSSSSIAVGRSDADDRRHPDCGRHKVAKSVVVGALTLPSSRSKAACVLALAIPVSPRGVQFSELRVLVAVEAQRGCGRVQRQARCAVGGEVLALIDLDHGSRRLVEEVAPQRCRPGGGENLEVAAESER